MFEGEPGKLKAWKLQKGKETLKHQKVTDEESMIFGGDGGRSRTEEPVASNHESY